MTTFIVAPVNGKIDWINQPKTPVNRELNIAMVLGKNGETYFLKSPINGRIVSTFVKPGEIVEQDQALMKIR